MGTLSTLLTVDASSSVGRTTPGWVQFCSDHLDYIAARSTTYAIDAPLMHQYKYDLKRFLINHLSRQQDIAWIVLLLNDLANDFEFFLPGSYVIPTDSLIQTLFHTYQTNLANSN